MIRKMVQTAVGLVFLSVIPLLWRMDLILTWPVICASLAGAWIHLAPPHTPVVYLFRHNPTDRGSTYLLIAAACTFFVLCIVDYGYFYDSVPEMSETKSVLGLISLIIGLGIRQWTVRSLGQFFTARVTLEEEHPLVNIGPYRILKVRHPAYLGTLFVAMGMALVLHSKVGLIYFAVIVVPAYLYRISVEENALNGQIGDRYSEYSEATWKLLPFLY